MVAYPAAVARSQQTPAGDEAGPDWRLQRIAALSTGFATTLVNPLGHARTYVFPPDDQDHPPFLADAGDGGAVVLAAVAAFRRSVGTRPTARAVTVAAGDRFVVSVRDSKPGDGEREPVSDVDLEFTAEVVEVKGVALLVIGSRDGQDRATARALFDMVGQVHRAWHRPIRLPGATLD